MPVRLVSGDRPSPRTCANRAEVAGQGPRISPRGSPPTRVSKVLAPGTNSPPRRSRVAVDRNSQRTPPCPSPPPSDGDELSRLTFKHNFARANPGRLSEFYSVGKRPLGEGSFAQVLKASHKETETQYAVKAINVSKIKDRNRFDAEVHIQQQLDHPHIVKIFEVFHNRTHIQLVMELCTGGELFDRIVSEAEGREGHAFDEKGAATYMKQILGAIHYLHSQNYVHRDIKPENFLLENSGRDAPIKVIDFGLAKQFVPGSEKMKTKAGTPYYVAPQVLQGSYDEKCDVWSCGVICYILLCGYPPFYGEGDDDILRRVRAGRFDFPKADWCDTSEEAKEFISLMLTFEPDERPSASVLVNHRWFDILGSKSRGAISKDLGARLRTFRSVSKLKKLALTLIATRMKDEDIAELKNTFSTLDKDNNGTLTANEIKDGMLRNKVEIPADIDDIIENLDTDGSGHIDYTEFIAATLTKKEYFVENAMRVAFRTFDLNNDGLITKSELLQVLGEVGSSGIGFGVADEMIRDADRNGDGAISFEEFREVLAAD